MQVYVLDSSSLSPVHVIDSFASLIWTKRYFSYGDFELYVPASKDILKIIGADSFIVRDDDSSVMVVEKIVLNTDAENGDYYIISGRSLESILLRRVFRKQFVCSDTTINGAAQKMVTECQKADAPSQTYRKISGLTVDTGHEFSANIQTQFTGQTLLDGIISLCRPLGIGIKMEISGTNLVVSFYRGEEKQVIFSPEFDNIISSQYALDTTKYSNVAYVAGEGEGSARKISGVWAGTVNQFSGLALREMFVDARDISSNNGEIETPEYYGMLTARGYEKLAENSVAQSFNADIEPRVSFKYKTDYDLGDIVTVQNEYGISELTRIVEVIESWDDTGYKCIPKYDSSEVSRVVLRDSQSYILKDSDGYILAEG